MDPHTVSPDWEAFYQSYKKPGYVPGYEITSKLGGGMFGIVFKAVKQSIGKDYAIKFLKVDDGEVRQAVLAELEQVKYFAQVDHPNLVSIEDRGEVDGIPYLVMAYAGAETLQSRLPGRAEDRDELVRYFLQACRGVAALHERSLVHFDLKPANVFLKGGVARVGDYGLSKLVTHSRGSLSMGRGTPYYMAPEMLQRRGDQRSDVYSLGVMLYELLCGDVPFRGENEWEVLKKHEQAPVAVPPQVTAREREVIERCLQKDPERRFQDVGEIVRALTAPLAVPPPAQVEPAAVRPVTPPAPPIPTAVPMPVAVAARPRPTGARGAVLTMAMLLVAFALFVWSRADMVDRTVGRNFPPRTAAAPVVTRPRTTASADKPTTLAAALHEFGRSAAAALVEAGQRRTGAVTLRSLTDGKLELPPDLDHYLEQLAPLAENGFQPGHAQKLERDGRCIVLAAIEALQHYDYADPDDQRRALAMQQFLHQATQFTDFAVAQGREPGDGLAELRWRLAADAWRRFAETFCKDDATYRSMLKATGKVVGRPN